MNIAPSRRLLTRLGRAAKDTSFILGGIFVALLIIFAVIGPELATNNPYLRDPLQFIDGELERAPIDPGEAYPLGTDPHGRDMVALLLYGARTTLTIAFIATAVRLLLGLTLGSLAGWGVGDRLITGLAELLAAVPGLILAMIIVFAVGIRRGQIAFVVAISVVGWGEVAQIIRSHVIAIREEEFIEGARAIGLSSLGILSRHVLPNLLSTMLALASLEMGSALLLLGELGFVAVFIGGGNTIAGDAATATTIFAEIPDWGAMLGTTWRYFRALPWLPAFPALAFLVSIFSFNLLGYGMQNFIDKGRFYPSGWSVLRFALVSIAILFGAQLLLSNTGPESEFKEKAEAFNVSRVWTDINFLSSAQLGGLEPGTSGANLAASYIAQQFGSLELTPFPTGSYFQTFPAHHGRFTRDVRMEIIGQDGEVLRTITEGIEYDPFLPFNREATYSGQLMVGRRFTLYEGLESGIFLILATSEPWVTLRIFPDEYFPDDVYPPPFSGPISFLGDRPALIIQRSLASELLADTGYDLEELEQWSEEDGNVVEQFFTGLTVRITVGSRYEEIAGVNVVGYIPGSDVRVQTQRIIVVAPYTTPSMRPGWTYPGADENASGVAIMLEIIRTWQEQEFVPKRTVVFAAFDEVGGRNFLDNPILPTRESDTWTAVILHGLGAGEEKLVRAVERGGLGSAFDQSARKMGSSTEILEYWPFFFAEGGGRGWGLPGDDSYAGIAITRLGDELSGTLLDSSDHLDQDLLQEAGETLAHYLMSLSSQ
jgi:peptide/nickel transport system permease protein